MDNLLTTEEKAGVKPYLFELLDQKMEEGRAEGMENTIRLFINKNPDWTDQQIAECFEVTIEFIAKIRTRWFFDLDFIATGGQKRSNI